MEWCKKFLTLKPMLKLLVLQGLWCASLILFRVVYTRSLDFIFLFANLMLASVPLMLSSRMISSTRVSRYLLFVPWLLFFPNAPYIITDLLHLKEQTGIPMWYDLLMILSAACMGMLLALISLQQMKQLVSDKCGVWLGWLFAITTIYSSGFAIYLGRFMRWHSVHVILSPMLVLHDIRERFMHPLDHPRTFGITFGYGTLLVFGYLSIMLFSRSVHEAKKE